MSKYIKIENEDDYVKDATGSHGIINNNLNAYEVAKKRAGEAQRQRDEMRETTRELNTLKSEMTKLNPYYNN